MVAMCRDHLARRGLEGDVAVGGVGSLPEDQTFDAVVALDVIEHIEDDVGALQAMRRALKPTGTLILSVPALSQLYGQKDVDVGHFRRYDKEALLHAMAAAELRVETCRFWNLLGIPPVFLSNLRGKRLDESVRYGKSRTAKALNRALGMWFRYVENPIEWPIGLTLIATARP